MKEKIQYEFLEDFDLSEIDGEYPGTHGRWSNILREWIKSDAKACRLACANQDEKRRCKSSLQNFIKVHKLDWTYVGERGTNNVYVVRS